MGSCISAAKKGKCSRKQIFGVEMTPNTAPKITDAAKFLNWNWWFAITEKFRATVFHRRGLHLMVLRFLILGNVAFFWVHDGYHWGVQYESYLLPINTQVIQQLLRWMSRLMTFVLSSYVLQLVRNFYFPTKKSAGGFNYELTKVVDTISLALDYDSPRANEMLRKVHNGITAIAYYAFAVARKDTKYQVKHKQLVKIFTERGLDGKFLLSLEKKQTIDVLRLAILKTINEERRNDIDDDNDNITDTNNNNDGSNNKGCMTQLDSNGWETLRRDMASMCGRAMSLTSCTKSNKLPFPYIQIVNWGTHVTTGIYMVFLFMMGAENALLAGEAAPFTCWNTLNDGSYIDPSAGSAPEGGVCSTKAYIFVNCMIALLLYFVLGMLDLLNAMHLVWENGLSHEHYLEQVEWRSNPLLPPSSSSSSQEDYEKTRPKNLDDLAVKPEVKRLKEQRSSHDDLETIEF